MMKPTTPGDAHIESLVEDVLLNATPHHHEGEGPVRCVAANYVRDHLDVRYRERFVAAVRSALDCTASAAHALGYDDHDATPPAERALRDHLADAYYAARAALEGAIEGAS